MRQHRVEAKIENGHKLLNRAFRTAKGFERQKLGRRRKTAISKSDAKDVARIDAETEAIKVCRNIQSPTEGTFLINIRQRP